MFHTSRWSSSLYICHNTFFLHFYWIPGLKAGRSVWKHERVFECSDDVAQGKDGIHINSNISYMWSLQSHLLWSLFPGVCSFLSARINQDALEKFLACSAKMEKPTRTQQCSNLLESSGLTTLWAIAEGTSCKKLIYMLQCSLWERGPGRGVTQISHMVHTLMFTLLLWNSKLILIKFIVWFWDLYSWQFSSSLLCGNFQLLI